MAVPFLVTQMVLRSSRSSGGSYGGSPDPDDEDIVWGLIIAVGLVLLGLGAYALWFND